MNSSSPQRQAVEEIIASTTLVKLVRAAICSNVGKQMISYPKVQALLIQSRKLYTWRFIKCVRQFPLAESSIVHSQTQWIQRHPKVTGTETPKVISVPDIEPKGCN